MEVKNKLAEITDWQQLHEIITQKWPIETVTTKTQYGSAFRSGKDYDSACIINENLELLGKNNAKLNKLKDQELKPGSVGYKVSITEIPIKDGNLLRQSRIYNFVMVNTKDDKTLIISLYKGFKTLANKMEKNSRKKLAVEVPNLKQEVIRKIVEAAFINSQVEIVLYLKKSEEVKEKEKAARETYPKNQSENFKNQQNKQKTTVRTSQTDTVHVQEEGISYADLLKKVKKSIDPSTIEVKVVKASSTKNGGLALVVPKGGQALKLRDEIVTKIKGVKAVVRK